jgi:predicted Zn-dependent peptidase
MYRKDMLSNGIRVVSETIPKTRAVSIGVWVKVGSRQETPRIGGISHFIEHLFFKGTSTRSARDIAIEMDSLGGEMNAFTSQETTTFYAKVVDEHLPAAIDILADVLMNAKFDPADMEKERNVILEEIKSVEDTPDDIIHDLFAATVWPEHALGRPILGTKDTIAAMRHQDVLDYVEGNYCPQDIVIAVSGNFEHEKLIALLDKRFGVLSRPGSSREDSSPAFARAIVVRKKELEQAQLCVGFAGLPYTHDDRYVLSALNTVLGNSMSSRLFQEIREQHALAYSIYSYVTAYRDAGLLTIYAGTAPANAVKVVQLIMKELRKVRDHGITKAEEERVRNQIKGSLILSLDSSNSRMSRLARQELYFGKYHSMDDIIKSVEAVTAEQVQTLAAKLFRSETLSLTVLGPLKKSDVPESVLEV